jgi:hypothetical protein
MDLSLLREREREREKEREKKSEELKERNGGRLAFHCLLPGF